MRILLDTHAFLWFALNDPRLSGDRLNLICDSQNEVFLSVASLWEISIKSAIGKLTIEAPFETFVDRNVTAEGIGILHISVAHLAELYRLPMHHRDPFDRMIIAQSIVERMDVMTTDEEFNKYNITLL